MGTPNCPPEGTMLHSTPLMAIGRVGSLENAIEKVYAEAAACS